MERVVSSVESLAPSERPICGFIAGAAVLDIGQTGRRGVELPKVRDTYWWHRKNFERLNTSPMDWRSLCRPLQAGSPARCCYCSLRRRCRR